MTESVIIQIGLDKNSININTNINPPDMLKATFNKIGTFRTFKLNMIFQLLHESSQSYNYYLSVIQIITLMIY